MTPKTRANNNNRRYKLINPWILVHWGTILCLLSCSITLLSNATHQWTMNQRARWIKYWHLSKTQHLLQIVNIQSWWTFVGGLNQLTKSVFIVVNVTNQTSQKIMKWFSEMNGSGVMDEKTGMGNQLSRVPCWHHVRSLTQWWIDVTFNFMPIDFDVCQFYASMVMLHDTYVHLAFTWSKCIIVCNQLT